LSDGVEHDAEESHSLRWPFGLVRVDDQAEGRENALCDGEGDAGRSLVTVDEEEVIEVTDQSLDAFLGEEKSGDREELCADSWS
jgi:hypothetical protein